jgi:1-deoxy-D-xylulose-5-phosphate reductoisomerase
MRRVAILGSTGSIGRQALEVIAAHPQQFAVAALAAGTNSELLAQQANTFQPSVLSLATAGSANSLRDQLSYSAEHIGYGEDGLVAAACASGAEIVLAATDGMVSLRAVFESVSRGLQVALANKELLVAAGRILCNLARSTGAQIVPVDSEHSAVFQCLLGEKIENVVRIVLTASGGPFWTLSAAQMEQVTPQEALRHPVWSMGAKNTIDSATLMNKGLEVIEASLLFGLSASQIDVVVHRQSIVHGFVQLRDGSVKAQLAAPDMRLPIGFALAYPQRLPSAVGETQTLVAIGLHGSGSTLSFEPVDEARFPSLGLAYRALELGGTYPAVLSAANEEAGRAFLQRQIKFTEICQIVDGALAAHSPGGDGLEEVRAADEFGRAHARSAIREAVGR